MFTRRQQREKAAGAMPAAVHETLWRELRAHVKGVGPADRAAAEAAITGLYELSRLQSAAARARPRFVWVESPFAVEPARSDGLGAVLGKELFLDWNLDERPVAGLDPGDPAFVCVTGRRPAWPLSVSPRAFPATARRLELWATLLRSAGWWWPTERACVVAERPLEVHLETGDDGTDRLHRAGGPAVRYLDGTDVHAWHGIVVPERYVTGELTAADWRTERNSERRQVIVDRMGSEWLLRNAAPRKIAADGHATLWRIANDELDDDEWLALCGIPGGGVDPADRPADILLLELESDSSLHRVPAGRPSLTAAKAWLAARR